MIAIQLYITPPRGKFTSIKSEKGITLIMVLIFMVTLSLVAAVGMRGVITGDKVVANERDRTLAFQAAESAGREAVAAINAMPVATHTLNVTTAGTYNGNLPRGGNAEFWRSTSTFTLATGCEPAANERFNWDSTATASANGVSCATSSAVTYDNAVSPKYFIELLPSVVVGTTTQCWYRVTSRATGGTRESEVILQVMFARNYAGAAYLCT